MGKQHLVRGIGRMSDIVMKKGKGSWIWTADNRKLLDFTSGIAVTNVGHCHPRVVQAVQEQAATIVHAQVNIGYHEPMLQLTDRLLPHLPKGLDTLFFATTYVCVPLVFACLLACACCVCLLVLLSVYWSACVCARLLE